MKLKSYSLATELLCLALEILVKFKFKNFNTRSLNRPIVPVPAICYSLILMKVYMHVIHIKKTDLAKLVAIS